MLLMTTLKHLQPESSEPHMRSEYVWEHHVFEDRDKDTEQIRSPRAHTPPHT